VIFKLQQGVVCLNLVGWQGSPDALQTNSLHISNFKQMPNPEMDGYDIPKRLLDALGL
jgi:hypothetical protein